MSISHQNTHLFLIIQTMNYLLPLLRLRCRRLGSRLRHLPKTLLDHGTSSSNKNPTLSDLLQCSRIQSPYATELIPFATVVSIHSCDSLSLGQDRRAITPWCIPSDEAQHGCSVTGIGKGGRAPVTSNPNFIITHFGIHKVIFPMS